MSKRASKAKVPPGEWTPELVELFNSQRPFTMQEVALTKRVVELQSRLDAIAAITSLRALTLAVSGDYLRAIHVLAAGAPKRECQAALKRWASK